MVVKPALLYGAECWIKVAEMRMIRWMCGHMRLDKIRNEVIKSKIGVASIEDKMERLDYVGLGI